MRASKHCSKIVFFVFAVIATSILCGYYLFIKSTQDPIHFFTASLYAFYNIAPLAHVLFFVVVTRAMCESYNKWTAEMLRATATPPLHSLEVNLLLSTT